VAANQRKWCAWNVVFKVLRLPLYGKQNKATPVSAELLSSVFGSSRRVADAQESKTLFEMSRLLMGLTKIIHQQSTQVYSK
jgi:hypothetical protein